MAQINLGHVVGQGVPSGGTAGQILKKNGSTNFDTSWATLDGSMVPVSAGDSTTVQQSLAAVKSDMGIVEDGNTATHTIAAGQYVIWKGLLYTASSAIPSGTTLSTSNLTAVSGGGLNSLNGNIANVNNRFSWRSIYVNNTYINDVGRTLTLTSSLQNVRQLMIIGYIGSISSANRVIFIIPVDGSIPASYYLTSYAGIIKSARIEGNLSSLQIISFSDNSELFINEIKAIG